VWSLFAPSRFLGITLWGILIASGFCTAGTVFVLQRGELNDQAQPSGLSHLLRELPFLPLDWLGVCWCLLAGAGTFLLLHWPQPQETMAARFRESFTGLGLFAASVLAVCADGVWLQWAGVMATGWLLCLILARDDTRPQAMHGAGISLIWFTIADFFWLFGLLYFGQIWLSPSVSVLTDFSKLAELSPEHLSLAVTGQSSLLIALILRCGLFPLMSWTRFTALRFRDSVWIILFGIGFSGVLFLRWGRMFNAFAEIHLLVVGLGILSIVLLGLLAVYGTEGPRRLVTIASIQIGMIWVGQSATIQSNSLTPALLVVSIPLLLALLSLGIDHLPSGKRSLVEIPGVLLMVSLLLCCGLLGQESLAVDVWHADWGPAFSPNLVLGAILMGQFLSTFALFRELSGARENLPPTANAELRFPVHSDITRWGWFSLGGVAIVCLFGFFGTIPFFNTPSQQQLSIPFPLVTTVLMLIGIVAAANWPDPTRSNELFEPIRTSPIQRLTGSDYYLPLAIGMLAWLPSTVLAWGNRFIDAFILTPIFYWLPSLITGRIAASATFVDEQTTESESSRNLIAAVLIMLAGIGLSGWL